MAHPSVAPWVRRLRLILPIFALAAIWLSMLLLGGGLLDRQVYERLYAGNSPALVDFAKGLSAIGQLPVLLTIGLGCLLWLWWKNRGRAGLLLLAAALAGRSLAELQKYEIGRVRPDIEPHLVLVKTSSFPSGHATSSMIFGLTVALALAAGTRWERAAVAFAILLSLLIGTSRVMLGVHWPSDVIGGWAFGLLWVLITFPLVVRIVGRPSSSRGSTAV
jgi:undecaprenyl-diphosphatase